MKYSVIKCVNGNFAIESEWSDLTKAIARFHKVCETHWNATDVASATIAIFDEKMMVVDRYIEEVKHEVEPTE